MKKIFLLLMLLVPAMTFAGCSDGNDDPQTEIPDVPDNPGGDDNDDDEPDPANPGNGKILIAYFSRWGNTNYPADVDASTGASIIINNGNRRGTTQVVADYIQTAVGGDVHLIETSAPYPVDFDDVRDLNHSEQENGTRPALKSRIGNMAQYKTVFIGYPVWATTVPQAIRLVPRIIRLRGENGRTVLHARRIRGRQQLSRRTGCGVRCNRDGRSRVAGFGRAVLGIPCPGVARTDRRPTRRAAGNRNPYHSRRTHIHGQMARYAACPRDSGDVSADGDFGTVRRPGILRLHAAATDPYRRGTTAFRKRRHHLLPLEQYDCYLLRESR